MGCYGSKQNDEEDKFDRVGKYGRLSCWYTNATSLKNKLDLVAAKNADYDVLMITETWLNETSKADIDGYKCYRQDRANGKTGGGVCIYVRECFQSHAVISPSTPTNVEAEQVWCIVNVDSKRILLG